MHVLNNCLSQISAVFWLFLLCNVAMLNPAYGQIIHIYALAICIFMGSVLNLNRINRTIIYIYICMHIYIYMSHSIFDYKLSFWHFYDFLFLCTLKENVCLNIWQKISPKKWTFLLSTIWTNCFFFLRQENCLKLIKIFILLIFCKA